MNPNDRATAACPGTACTATPTHWVPAAGRPFSWRKKWERDWESAPYLITGVAPPGHSGPSPAISSAITPMASHKLPMRRFSFGAC